MLNIDEVLTRGVAEILPSKKALAKLMAQKKITVYQGFDPTAPSLHIGHFIGIKKLSQFQKLGHKIIFLIGDFTGLIGDPSDKTAARKRQTRQDVLNNLKDYKKQVERILDFEGPNAAKIKFNSEWLAKLTFEELIDISSHFTVQQMIERDMFQDRLKNNKPIYLHEFLYPLMQGYDSVAMDIDLEVGGNDQLFNMLAGRNLMKDLKGKDKYVLSMKLLTDESGKKMGKTEGNAINLSESPAEIFRKIINWPDTFISPGVELLTDLEIGSLDGKDPIEAKKTLATELIRQVKGEEAAKSAEESFNAYSKTNFPGIPTGFVERPRNNIDLRGTISLASGASATQTKNLITSGSVDVNGEKVTDPKYPVQAGDEIRVGKNQFYKVKK